MEKYMVTKKSGSGLETYDFDDSTFKADARDCVVTDSEVKADADAVYDGITLVSGESKNLIAVNDRGLGRITDILKTENAL
jgi:hypothetical protein